MKSKDLKPLKVSLHGMDERMQKMMSNYLKLPCKGVAVVVEDEDAHAEIVDVDLSLSKSLLNDRLATSTDKPIIALSLHNIPVSNIIYVKKPIQVPEFVAALRLAKDVLLGKKVLEKTNPTPDSTQPSSAQQAVKVKAPGMSNPELADSGTIEELPGGGTALESSKDVSDFITQAIQKSEASKKVDGGDVPLEETVKENINLENDSVKETKPGSKTSGIESLKKQSEPVKNTSNIVHFDMEISTAEETAATINKKISPSAVPAFLKQEEITFKTTSEKNKAPDTPKVEPTAKDKELGPDHSSEKKQEPQKSSKKITQKPEAESEPVAKVFDEKPEIQTTSMPSNGLFNALWQRKGLIAGLTCLISLLLVIYIFQLTPLYEAKASLFVGNGSPDKHQNELAKDVAQNRINEITSRFLANRVINSLKLNTLPEFIEASVIADSSDDSGSAINQENKAAEQLSKITDYFLKNLTVTQFKNTPIINIEYQAKNPESAFKIVNELVNEYLVMQQNKIKEKNQDIDNWESKKIPDAKNKLKQSKAALTLYIEMNKWSQFEQQFAEDMGVNSEIRDLEKKVKADQALYQILVKRLDNLKNESESLEVKLISNAEIPSTPSYPNRQRLLLITLLSALLISIIIALILSAMNFSGKKIIGEPV